MDFKAAIRTIPDYPKPGIMFRDITTLLGNPRAFRSAVDQMVQPYAGLKIDKVAGLEARGFILGGAVNGGRYYGVAPQISVRSPDQVGVGRLLPTISVDQYAATLATWFGVAPSELPSISPNIGRFNGANLGFMQ